MKQKDLLKILACVLIVLVVVVFIVKGCSSKSIVGSWKYEKAEYIYTFNKDGTGKYFAVGTVMTFTYTIEKEKDQISILFTGEDTPMEAKYSIKENKLTIDDSLGKDTVYIRYNQKESKK